MADEFLGHPRLARQAAKDAGLDRYRHGKPCINGHLCERITSTGRCVECVKDRRKKWRRENRKKYLAGRKRYRDRYPTKIEATRKLHATKHADRLRKAARERARRRSNTEGYKQSKAVSKAKRESLLTKAAGRPRPEVCDLCGDRTKKIVFDHCHKHGHFRGWLCDRCNWVLGLVKDDPAILQKMAVYLEKQVAKLKAKTRNALPGSAFAGPDRSYPIEDESHARNALARASQHASSELKAKIKAKVRRRYPNIHVEGEPSKPRADRASRTKM